MSHFICFDLEGPLSPQDNAYELMKLFPHGAQVFEVISRYDDLLTLEGRKDYEPGDTLALIVPFLLCHGISETDVRRLAQRAKLVDGASELIFGLHFRRWRVFCISTSYEQYALTIAQRLGIARENVACTLFPLDSYAQTLGKEDFIKVEQAEREILSFPDEATMKSYLDHFFWVDLPLTKLGKTMMEIKPMGGGRKVEALKRLARDYNQPLSNFIVVGDSITDFKMLQVVKQAGGLAVAFNANEYALPHSTLGLASTHLSDLAIALEAWEEGGKEAVEQVVKGKEREGGGEAVEQVVKRKEREGGIGDRGYFHWLIGIEDLNPVIEIHRRIRRLVREEAAKLG